MLTWQSGATFGDSQRASSSLSGQGVRCRGERDAHSCRRLDLVGQRLGSETRGPRSGRNAARSSAANSSGSSQAAKWPPRWASPK